MLTRWVDLIRQPEFHHSWPQWLGGPVEQTQLHLPRILHNFRGMGQSPVGFPSGFHQRLNDKLRAFFPYQVTLSNGQQTSIVNGAESVNILRADTAAAGHDLNDVIRTLVAETYRELFSMFRLEQTTVLTDEAKVALARFVDEMFAREQQ